MSTSELAECSTCYYQWRATDFRDPCPFCTAKRAASPRSTRRGEPLAPRVTHPTPAALTLPTDSAARKAVPLARGCLDYFPAALAAVAALSQAANDKHNPGEPMHHARGKSADHADCILRHLVDRGTVDPEDGIRHSVKVAWRALALLQEELEASEGAPLPRGAKLS